MNKRDDMSSILALLKSENIDPLDEQAVVRSLSETVLPSKNIQKYRSWLSKKKESLSTIRNP